MALYCHSASIIWNLRSLRTYLQFVESGYLTPLSSSFFPFLSPYLYKLYNPHTDNAITYRAQLRRRDRSRFITKPSCLRRAVTLDKFFDIQAPRSRPVLLILPLPPLLLRLSDPSLDSSIPFPSLLPKLLRKSTFLFLPLFLNHIVSSPIYPLSFPPNR